ncbi:hypothetical protein ODJ79_29395 [Actinoplanes sp. KI2]|uniref:hypothetical protein n=1 Tax=Actinoplanes sp. KI2 TaxID=2983315 RepID=UPI0021D5931B|nr:hypothetical protein [Actinoplanes sp. KI2]MCU7727852.1 hypothetical protein [Actinoplanes sp. KI2]
MSKASKPADERDARLRLEARLHDGVIPVPFLGQTWQARGPAYWRRRVGAVVLMVLALALVGGMAVGFTIGIVGDGDDAVRIALAVVYDLTAVAGVRSGLRKIAAAPLDDRAGGPGTFFPNGLLALVLAPYGTGLVLTILLAMFGRDFIGERRAREMSKPSTTS